jgi:hypothetical protein
MAITSQDNSMDMMDLTLTEKPTMDPFVKLVDCENFILQHFSGNEVMQIMKVSSTWHTLITSLPKPMSKLRLNIKNHSKVPEDEMENLKAIQSSERKYRKMNLAFCCIPSPINSAPKLAFLEKFAENLFELDIKFDNYILLCMAPKTLNLPKLKNLTVTGFNAKELVKRVKFDAPLLTRLVIRGELYMVKYNQGKTEKVLDQFTSLTYLYLDYINQDSLEVILNQMPKLKTLHSYDFDDDVKGIDLQPNQIITEAQFRTHPDQEFNKKFLQLLVNLEKCEIRGFVLEHIELIEWIIKNCFKMRKLHLLGTKYPMDLISTAYNELKVSNRFVNKLIDITWMRCI